MPSWIIFIIAVSLSLLAQILVSATFWRYGRVEAQSGTTGLNAARRLLDENGLAEVGIEPVEGKLTDHFDPRNRTLRLSDSTREVASVAALGVAAHETGHALQYRDGYTPNKIRENLLWPANVGSRAGPFLAGLGFVLESAFGHALVLLGIGLFAGSVLFYLVTLPVEFDASRRALLLLDESGLLTAQEMKGARAVLRAAAFTYVASALTALLYFFRFAGMASSRKR